MEYQKYELGKLLPYEQPTHYIVSSTDYKDSYETPVITAGKSFILGYTNEKKGVFDKLPVIIFDDFTTASKYVDFKFKVKSSAMKILTPNITLVLPKYIFYRLQTINVDHKTHKRYWIQHYSKILVDIPPIPEQERIVSRIEEMFSQLDAGVETLNALKAKLSVYRQAVFASVIGKYKGETKKLSDIATTIDGDRGKNYPKKEDFSKEGFCLFLTAANVKLYGWAFDDKAFISKEKDSILHGGRLSKNDIVITTRGTLGNVAIYDESVPYDAVRINSCMLIVRVKNETVSPYYLAQYLMSPMFKYQIAKLKSGTAQPQIPANILKDISLNIPCLENQHSIIEELTAKFSVCDSIEQTVDTALIQTEAMRQSILKDAFEGRL